MDTKVQCLCKVKESQVRPNSKSFVILVLLKSMELINVLSLKTCNLYFPIYRKANTKGMGVDTHYQKNNIDLL